MITTPPPPSSDAGPAGTALPTFRTPVRGHAFAPRRGPRTALHPGQPAQLVPEPDNPADPHAVAVWVDDGTDGWRIGYLDRTVAARLAPRLAAGLRVDARVEGYTREPGGRWERPLVVLRPTAEQPTLSSAAAGPDREPQRAPARRRRSAVRPADAPVRPPRVWGRPPGVARRTVG